MELIRVAIEAGVSDPIGKASCDTPSGLVGNGVERRNHGDRITVEDLFTTSRRGRIPGTTGQGAVRVYRALSIHKQGTGYFGPGMGFVRPPSDPLRRGRDTSIRCGKCLGGKRGAEIGHHGERLWRGDIDRQVAAETAACRTGMCRSAWQLLNYRGYLPRRFLHETQWGFGRALFTEYTLRRVLGRLAHRGPVHGHFLGAPLHRMDVIAYTVQWWQRRSQSKTP
jgi:hypothetical protein